FLTISFPATFIWAPTLFLYIRSRLYVRVGPTAGQLLHAVPALIMFIIVSVVITRDDVQLPDIRKLGQNSYYFMKFQLSAYVLYSLFLIYRYRKDIQNLTSSDEKRKLNWLLLFCYGILLQSSGDILLNLIPEFRFSGLGYILFWIFISIFFFKAIIDPDQFLGIDERKLVPVKLTSEKGKELFRLIENTITENKLFLDPLLSLNNVAKATKISDRMVSQSIKQNTTVNFTDYINLKRIDFAKDLLRNTTSSQKNILEILYESGFNSKSVFNAQFKKHTGISPKEFRKNCHSSLYA
ncbi:MAG TPA: AraC family transcriptional regulator, partial [Bacteroidales bacterium]|nr:AraC family transcriptional regulator [Bacteroidales bacterium]